MINAFNRQTDVYQAIIFCFIILFGQMIPLNSITDYQSSFSSSRSSLPRLQLESTTNIILQTPSNNSHITEGTELLFHLVDSFNNTVFYYWETQISNASLEASEEYFTLSDPGWDNFEAWICLFLFAPIDATTLFKCVYRFYYDTRAPQISTSYSNGSLIPAFSTLSVTFSENVVGSQYRWVGGSYLDIAFNASAIEIEVPLPSGVHLLEFLLQDADGNVNNSIYEYIVTFTILADPVNESVVQSGVMIELTFSDPHNALYAWDSDLYSGVLDPTPASEGSHTLHVNVELSVGEYELWNFIYDVDNTPIIIGVSPTNGTVIPSTNITITLSEDPQTVWATIDGQLASLNGNNPYWTLLPSTYGFTILEVYATDEAGNLGKYVGGYNISLGIILLTPYNNTVVDQGTPIVYQLNAEEWRTILFNVDNTSFNTTYTPSIPSVSGIHNLTVYLEDIDRHWTSQFFQWAVRPRVHLEEYSNHSHIRPDFPLNFTFGEVLPRVIMQWGQDAPSETLDASFVINPLSNWSNPTTPDAYLQLKLEGQDSVWLNTTFHFVRDENIISITLSGVQNNSIIHAPFLLQAVFNETPIVLYYNWDAEDNVSITPTTTFYSFTVPSDVLTNPHSLELFIRDSAYNWNSKVFLFYTGVGITDLFPSNGSTIKGGSTLQINLTSPPVDFHYSWFNVSDDLLLYSSGWLGSSQEYGFPSPVVSSSLRLLLEYALGAGEICNQTLYYIVDSTPPDFSVVRTTSPFTDEPNLVVNTPYWIRTTESFEITVSENVLFAYIIWNNGSYTNNQTFFMSDDNFTLNLDSEILPDVLNNLTIHSIDYVGNEQYLSWFFWLDDTLPTVSSCVPRRNTAQLPSTNVSVTFSELVRQIEVQWFLNSESWKNQSFSSFVSTLNFTLPVEETETLIEMSFYDLAGNLNSYSCRFTIDSSPPQITLTPRNNSALNSRQVIRLDLSEPVAENSYYQWEFDSLPTSFNTSSVQLSLTTIPEGTYRLTVYVEDLLGNARLVQFRYTIDDTPFTADQVELGIKGFFNSRQEFLKISFTELPLQVLGSWDGKSNVSLSITILSLISSGGWGSRVLAQYVTYIDFPRSEVFSSHQLVLYIQDQASNWSSFKYQFLRVPTETDVLSVGLILTVLVVILAYTQRRRILARFKGPETEKDDSPKKTDESSAKAVESPSPKKTRKKRK